MSITINKFAKGEKRNKKNTPNTVIYTRVSSEEQKEGHSLDIQERDCLTYASKQNYNVKRIFGQTNESAKTDDREEFTKMLNYVKSKGNDILVHKYNRFSRSGSNAFSIIAELKAKHGIYVIAVTEPLDPSTPSGELQQAILLSFSKFDNDTRREQTVNGMIERLNKGLPCGQLPVGYARDKNTDTIYITEDGKLIREGFLLFQKGYSIKEISIKIGALGLKKDKKRWNAILKNPLYAGYIANSLLNGEVKKGRFKPIIPEKIFLEINKRRESNNRIFTKKKMHSPSP